MSTLTISTSSLPPDEDLEQIFSAILNSGSIPTKDKANSGPNDDEAVDWIKASLDYVDNFWEAYPDVFVTSNATYDVKA